MLTIVFAFALVLLGLILLEAIYEMAKKERANGTSGEAAEEDQPRHRLVRREDL